jgi:hypothetical protein
MPDKVSPSKFAASVKEKYPEYKDVDDLKLANAMIEKYPEYKDKVDFGIKETPVQTNIVMPGQQPSVSKYQKAVNDDRSEIGKTLSSMYNGIVSGLESLGGAVADLPAQFQINAPGFTPASIGKSVEETKAFRQQPVSERLKPAKELKKSIAKAGDIVRSGYTTREEEKAMAGQFNVLDGIGLNDIQGLVSMSGRMASDMALGAMTGGTTFVLQGYNDAVEDYDAAAEKAGLEANANARGLYGIAGGVINGLLEKFAVDKIVGDTPVFRDIQRMAIANVLKNTANVTGKKAVDAIETAAVAEIKKLTSDLKSKGIRAAYRAGVEGGTESVQAALEDGAKFAANAVQGNDVFNEDEIKKGFLQNIVNSGVAGGIMGPVFGAGADKLFGRNVNTQVLKDISEASTPEQLAAINDELAATFDENNFTQEERDAVMANANRYAQIKQTLPQGTSAIAQTIAIPLIEDRIKLDNEIQNRKNNIENVDEALRTDEEASISLLEDKRAQINDDIREVVNNEKFDYFEQDGKFYKKIGENTPEEISRNRFDLQQIKTGNYATQTSEGTVQEGGTTGNIGQRQGTQEEGTQGTTTQANSRYRNISSEKAVGIPSFLGMQVTYKLPTRTITGTLVQEGQTLSVEDENGDVVAELGNIDELSNMSPEEMNLTVIEPNVELTESGFSVDGKELFNENENPFDAVSVGQNGNVMNVVLTTAGGKRRKFRGRVAQKIADQIDVRENKRIEEKDQKLQKEFALPKSKAPVVITTQPTIARVTEDNLGDLDTIQGTPTQKKVLSDIKNVISAIGAAVRNITGSPVSVNVHDQKSFTEAVIQAGGKQEDAASRGFYMADDGSIHLNMDAIASDTMLHEGFHPILDILAKYNPKIINDLFAELESIPEAAGIIAQAKETYKGDVTQKKEAITDFVAAVADGRIVLNPSNFQKIKNFILDMLNKIGIGQGGSTLINVQSEKELVDLAKFITEKFTTGETITLEALDLIVGKKQYDSSEGIDIDETLPEEGTDRGPQFSKQTVEAARKNLKSIASLIGTKISRVVFYDLTRVGPLDIKNIKTGYTPSVEGKGGPFYSYMEQRTQDKAVLAFVSINQAIQSLQRQILYPEGTHAVASQNPQTAHLGNKSTLSALFGDGIGIFQKAAKTKAQETEIVNVLAAEIDRLSKMDKGEAPKAVKKILKTVDLASIKTLNDFRDKILLGAGDSFGSRGSIFAALLQGKQTKVTAATRDSHKILHYKYGIPTIADIASGNNQKELSTAELGDVIKLVKPSTDPVIYTTSKEEFDKYSSKPTPEMKKAGIRIELLPESSAHESYPFILAGENVALLDNYISAAQLYKKFEKLPKKQSFFSVGRMKKFAEAGEIPTTVVQEKTAPQFQRVAPNGKPSNLNAQQYKQVRTPEFKNWFGDWENDPKNASKVVDENGEPKVMYHGGASFDEFKNGVGVDRGIYFTDNKYFAQDVFATQYEIVERDKRNDDYSDVPSDMLESGEWDSKYFKYAKVYNTFLNVRNPQRFESIDAKSIPFNYTKDHDGLIADSTGDFGYKGNQVVVFNPNQIKSATGNTGAFSTSDNRIQFQKKAQIGVEKQSGTTQVATTTGSYTKAAKIAEKLGAKSVLDYGAGLGLGSDAIRSVIGNVESFEPNSERWQGSSPVTYTNTSDINKKYDSVINLNVLNVVPKDIRDAIVMDIFDKLNVGGNAIISTRKWSGDVNQAKNYVKGPEDKSVIIKRKSGGKEVDVYQKGFDGNELVDYINEILGDAATVTKDNSFGAAGVIINKKSDISEPQFQKAPTKPVTKEMGGIIKKGFKEQVRYGILGKENVKLKELMSGELSAELATAETRVKETMKTIKKYGGSVTEKDISDFMQGNSNGNQIPLDLATQLSEMRAQIDGLTERLIQLGVVDSQESIDYYRDNMGKYMLRSYESINFKDTKTLSTLYGKGLNIDNVAKKLKNVDKTVVDAALKYLSDRAKAADQTLTDAEAMKIAKADANEILSDSEDYVMNKGLTGSTNVKSLRQRKDISPEIRALMGEYTDPLYNYYSTIFKIASLTSSRQYLNSLKEFGMGKFFFNNKTEDATVKFAGDASDALAPLNGIYTFPEIKESLQIAQKETTNIFLQMAGRVRMFKTVYNPSTHVKNIIGNMGFAVSNGHWNNLPEAYKYIKGSIKGGSNKDVMQMMETLNRYGVLNNVIGVGELKSYFDNNESIDDFLKTIYNNANKSTTAATLGKAKANLSKIPKAIEKAYAIEDDVFKILAFVNESNRYAQAIYNKKYDNLSATEKKEIDGIASEIVKDTFPTFSRVPKGVKTLSKVAFLGNFLSFPVESVRTQYNSLALARKEIKSGNSKLKRIGLTRLSGAIAYNSLFSTLSIYAYNLAGAGLTGAIGMMFGDDEEENKTSNAIKMNLAPWNKNSEVYVSRFKDGFLEYYDIGSLDSYGYQRRVWNAFWSTKNKGEFDEMMASGIGEALDPWMTKDFVISSYMGLTQNDDGRGGNIYNPEAKPMDKYIEMSKYVGKQFGPGAVGSAIKIADAYQKGEYDKVMDELGAQVFARHYTVDLNKQFQNYIYTEGAGPDKEVGFKDRLSDARKLYLDAKRQNLTPVELSRKYQEALDQYKSILLTANEYYNAAILGGTNPKTLRQSMAKSRIGRDEAKAIITGAFSKYDQAYIPK